MAANLRSLQLTDRYAARLADTAARVERLAKARWNLDPSDFDASYASWLDVVVPLVTQAQRQNQRLTQAYLTAFITSETGRRPKLPSVDPVAGRSRDGRDLREAWTSPPIKAKIAISEGRTAEEASAVASSAAIDLVNVDTYHGARGPAAALLAAAPFVTGYRRVTVGQTCGACLGAADGSVLPITASFQIHAHCDCVAEPAIRGLPTRRPTGQQIFDDLNPGAQDQMVGARAAAAIRDGQIGLKDLVGESPMVTEANWITQKPLSEAL